MHWEDIKKNMVRQLTLCDLDFTDLQPDDDMNDVIPGVGNGKVPPPPPMRAPPPMLKSMPPPTNLMPPPCYNDKLNGQKSGDVNGNGNGNTILKSKKTVSRCEMFNLPPGPRIPGPTSIHKIILVICVCV